MLFTVNKRLTLLFGLILQIIAFQYVFGQDNEKKTYKLRVRLVNSKNYRSVDWARIINKNSRMSVISDTSGVFSIPSQLNDTLYVSTIGYYPVSFIVSDSLIWQLRIPEIKLVERIYELENVNLFAPATYQEFKLSVLHAGTYLNTTKITERLKGGLDLLPKYPEQQDPHFSLGSPVTGLYMLLSKKGKDLKRLENALEKNKVTSAVLVKYNRQIVSIATGLTGDLLEQFMLFCRPDDGFILVATEYEIYQKIFQCYDLFLESIKK
jgi:hypothetical protein